MPNKKTISEDRNAVVYATGADEDERSSIDEQLEQCRSYASSSGYDIRREFSALGIDACERSSEILSFLGENPRCRHLIAQKADRLTLSDFYEFQQLGVKVHFVQGEEEIGKNTKRSRRAPGVRAKKAGKKIARGAATQLVLYPRPGAKAVIVEGSRLADMPMSSFCIVSTLKETARLLGRSVEDLGISGQELKSYWALAQKKRPATSKG